jgi:hypothetical protein
MHVIAAHASKVSFKESMTKLAVCNLSYKSFSTIIVVIYTVKGSDHAKSKVVSLALMLTGRGYHRK